MIIHVENVDQKATITIKGRFDLSKQRYFHEAYDPLLRQAGLKVLEIVMNEIEYFDSTSLGMLLLLRESAQERGKEIQLSKPSPTVAQTLEIANFNRLFSIAW